MRYFTPETATRTLPLVRRIAADLVGLQFEVNVRGDRINALAESGRGLDTPAAHAEELADMRASLQADRDRMSEIEDELAQLGVIIHSPATGALDFPAKLDQRDVRLCWQPGEESVTHWHASGDAPHQRQPIADLVFDPISSDAQNDSDNGSEADSHSSVGG